MNVFVKLLSNLVIRRLSYVVAPMLVALASQHWWVQDTLKAWNLDINNVDSVSAMLVAVLGALWLGLNEYWAWKRDRHNKGQGAEFADLVAYLHTSGKLEDFFQETNKLITPAMCAVLDDLAKQQAKKEALAKAAKVGVLLVALLPVYGYAQDTLPAPTVTVNTNTINTIVAVWDKSDVPAGIFNQVKDLIKFSGVAVITGDGLSSGGMAALASVIVVNWDACKFDIGPTFVCGLDNKDQFYSGVGLGIATAFVGAKLQEKLDIAFADVPVLDLLPRYVDFSGFKFLVGGGAILGGQNDWEPVKPMGFVGGGGIKFGKNK